MNLKSNLDDVMVSSLAEFMLEVADDELILGHRNSEWCGHAPIIEEDIAFANIALDEIGHAMLWYRIHAELAHQHPDTYPDQLVYFRDGRDFRSSALVSLPKGDWAFTILRQYFFDVYEKHMLERLINSSHLPVAHAAAKIRVEETYHLRHLDAWVRRLGLGTGESNRRMTAALVQLWPYSAQLFESNPARQQLEAAGLLPGFSTLEAAWRSEVEAALPSAGLSIPILAPLTLTREDQPEVLLQLVEELAQVARSDPEAQW